MLSLGQVSDVIRIRSTTDIQMTMGVACATLPTSSSFCIIFFMRAFECQEEPVVKKEIERNAFSRNDGINEHRRNAYNGKFCRLVSGFHLG